MTVEQVIAAAIVRNRKTQPNIQVAPAELIGHYNRALSGLFAVAARVNPSYFGDVSGTVQLSSGSFARPATAELVYRIEDPDGNRVWIVDVGERDAEPSRPAVYPWGRALRPANALAEALDGVVFYFSRTPVLAEAVADDVDPDFPAQHHQLLVDELAVYLALKDQRYDEVGALTTDRDAGFGLYIASLEHDVIGRTRVSGQSERFDGPSVVSLQSLIAGAG